MKGLEERQVIHQHFILCRSASPYIEISSTISCRDHSGQRLHVRSQITTRARRWNSAEINAGNPAQPGLTGNYFLLRLHNQFLKLLYIHRQGHLFYFYLSGLQSDRLKVVFMANETDAQ